MSFEGQTGPGSLEGQSPASAATNRIIKSAAQEEATTVRTMVLNNWVPAFGANVAGTNLKVAG